jgi:hypothetical protein
LHDDPKPPWRIYGIISDIEASTKFFSAATFSWVYNEASAAAHLLSVWSLKNSIYGHFASFCGPSNFVCVISKEAKSSAIV